jgi:hypothetical protein
MSDQDDVWRAIARLSARLDEHAETQLEIVTTLQALQEQIDAIAKRVGLLPPGTE